MKTKLEAMVAFLAGRAGEDAQSIRLELANPDSAASQFLSINRDLSANLFGDHVTKWLGIPPGGRGARRHAPPANPSSPVRRRVIRALPLGLSILAVVVSLLLWLDCRTHRKHLEQALEAALAKPKEQDRVVAKADAALNSIPPTTAVPKDHPNVDLVSNSPKPEIPKPDARAGEAAPTRQPPTPPTPSNQGEEKPGQAPVPQSLPIEKVTMPRPIPAVIGPAKAGQIEVPALVGLSYADAMRLAESAGLMLRTADIPGSGLISRQVPSAGTAVPSGSTVVVFIDPKAQPDSRVQVPDVCGLLGSEKARSLLKQAGLEFAAYTMAEGGRILVKPPNYNQLTQAKIIQQTPAAGSTVAASTVVACIFEQAKKNPPQPVTVPNVVGKTQAEAELALAAAGLTMKALNTAANARAVSQTPMAGSAAKPGDCVTVDFQAKKGAGK